VDHGTDITIPIVYHFICAKIFLNILNKFIQQSEHIKEEGVDKS